MLAFVYAGLLTTYVLAWAKIPVFVVEKNLKVETSISIIIPVRNEAKRIEECLLSILSQKGVEKSLYEIIVIDDYSGDDTAIRVKLLTKCHSNLKLIKLEEELGIGYAESANKKKAIELAISCAKGQLIVTTDGDTVRGPFWLKTIALFYQENLPKMIAAPVCFIGEENLIQAFQSLDFAGMMVATGASVNSRLSNMANGANFIYTKEIFEEVKGFEGIDKLASGDDMLLMAKVSEKYPEEVLFLKSKEATVYTYPEKTLNAFFQQRLRWASKSAYYQDKRITILLGLVFLFNWSIIINFILILLNLGGSWSLLISQLLVKSLSDFIFLFTGTSFFDRRQLLWLFLPSQIIHILYIAIVGFFGNMGVYNWKGRKVKS